MKHLRIVLAASVAVVFVSGFARAEGFHGGDLLATSGRTVYAFEPSTGASRVLWGGDTSLGDIVYNPITGSAFITDDSRRGNIYQLTFDSQNGFQMSPFLTGLDDPKALAVDNSGNVYFNQSDFVHHRIWKATPDGTVSPVSEDGHFGLFTPTRMALAPGDQALYVSSVPNNQVEVVNLDDGTVSHLVDLSFPEGLDVANDGTAYAVEGGPGGVPYQVVTIAPNGEKSVFSQEPWMEFLGSGFWGDLEYDDLNETIYVAKGDLYSIDRDQKSHRIMDSHRFGSSTGLDLVPVPEPGPFAMLAIGLFGLLGCQWKKRA